MRISVLVLGILGGLASTLLGMKWQGDVNEHQRLLQSAESMGC